MVVVENITDKDIKRIMEETKQLNEEINVRQSYEEDIEATLYARYENKEISYNQMRKVCDEYNLDIPLSDDEENSIDFIDEHYNIFSWYARPYMCSRYKHYDTKNKIYCSVLDKIYEWENGCIDSNDYDEDYWDDWVIQQFFEKNAVDNGNLQLAYKFGIEEEEHVLCIYKDHKLLGAYVEGGIERIKRLIAYDDKLVAEDLDTYKELLELLNKQQEEFWRIIYANELLKNKLKMTEEYNRQVVIDALNRSKYLNSNVHLNNN